MWLADEELGMRSEHAIGQELAELFLGPPVHNAVNDLVQIRSRVDVVGNASGEDGEDGGSPFSTVVAPCKEPVASAEDKSSELTLTPVVGGLDVSVVEKEQQASPLAMQVAEGLAERGLGRNDGALAIEPRAKLVGHWA
jgi:hypothetical protein